MNKSVWEDPNDKDTLRHTPYVGDSVQVHVQIGVHDHVLPGQILAVRQSPSDAMAGEFLTDILAFDRVVAHDWREFSELRHGSGHGFPFWVYPGEDC